MDKAIFIGAIIGELTSLAFTKSIDEIQKSKFILYLINRFGISDKDLPILFNATYDLALTRYSTGKAKELVEIFSNDYIKKAFKVFFETDNDDELIAEIQGAKEWHPAHKKISELDIDLLYEIESFKNDFLEISKESRNIYQISLDKNIRSVQNDIADIREIDNQILEILEKILYQANEKESINEKFETLRQGLQEREDLKKLGDSVYEAEALYVEGKLPTELNESLFAARNTYDRKRRIATQMTTVDSFKSYQVLKIALDDIGLAIKWGNEFYYDDRINQQRPITEMLEELQKAYFDCEYKVIQLIINKANNYLNISPFMTVSILQNALHLSLLPSHDQIVRNKLNDIYQKIEENQQLLQQFIAQNLSPSEYKILELFVVHHYNSQKIASSLQLNPIYVEMQLQKIREKLKIHFGLEQVNDTTLITYLNNYWQKDNLPE